MIFYLDVAYGDMQDQPVFNLLSPIGKLTSVKWRKMINKNCHVETFSVSRLNVKNCEYFVWASLLYPCCDSHMWLIFEERIINS